MKIKRLGKILGIIAVVILLLLIIGIVSLNSFLKSEKCKNLIIGKIETALNVPIEMKHFRASIFSGVQLDGFGIKNPQGFPEGYFLKTDSIILKYNFFDLLRRKIKIGEIKIVNPTINLQQKSDESWNFPIVSATTDSETISTKEKPHKIIMALPLITHKTQIVGGNFTYAPLEENKNLAINNLTLSMQVHSINSTPNMGLNLSVDKIDSSIVPPIEDIKGSIKTSKGTAYFDNISLRFSEGSVAIKGDTTIPVDEQDAEYKAEISIKDIDLETVIGQFLPEAKGLLKGILTADVTIKGKGLDALADMKLTIPSLTVKDQIKIDQIKSNIQYDKPNFTIQTLNMKVFRGSVEGKGKGNLEDFKNPVFDVNLNMNKIDAGTALNALGQDSMLAQGKVAGNIHADGNINDMKADGKISSPKLNLKKMGQITNISAPFKATITKQTKEITLQNFSAKIYGGSVGGNANITFKKGREPNFSTKLSMSNLEAGQALKELAGKAFLTGKTKGNIKLAGRGGNLNALTGSTNITFRNGKVATHPVQDLLALFIPPLKSINFVSAQFLSTIGNGKVNIKSATLENPKLLKFHGKGQIKLSNQKLSIPSHLSLRCAASKKLPLISKAFAEEDDKWCGMDFNIFGTLSKPQTDLEEKLGREAIGGAIEQIFDKDKDEDKGGGIEDIFQDIFK